MSPMVGSSRTSTWTRFEAATVAGLESEIEDNRGRRGAGRGSGGRLVMGRRVHLYTVTFESGDYV